ncbi:MAG: T9SS type A sorting domain-containing protein, partial [Bacteroidota bacterium]
GIDEPQPIYPCSSQSDQLTSYDATSVSPTMSCLDDLEIGFTEQILPNSCDQNGPLLQLLWTATTPCGYIDSLEYIVELIDNDAPTFYGVEEEIILSCGKELPTVEVYDDCSTPILQMAYDTLVGTCPQDYRVVRTITATDMCGNSESVTQLIHFIDQEAPVFEVAPNVCADEATEEIWAFDACQDNWINADLIHESYLNSCGDLVLIERIWMATDACGNSQEFRQVIYPDDYQLDIFFANPEDSNTLANLPSTLSLANPNHMAILERLEASTVQARTPCGEIIEGEFMIEIEYTDNCEDGIAEIRTYRWFFLDICGKRTEYVHHFAIDYSQDLMIEIEQNTDVFCSTEIPDLEIFNYQNHFNYEVTESDLRNENGDGLVIREVSATDPCGNFGTATQTIYCYNTTDLSCLIEGEVNPICQSGDNEYYVSIAGGTAPYTIYWQVNGQDCYIQSVNGETAQIKFGFGLAQIIVEVIDANGCQTSCELEVNCTGGTHNRPTTAEYQISSEPDLQDDKVFQIYPNPANQLLFIKSPEGEVTAIEVYLRDQLGRLVLEENSHQQTTALNLEKLPAGLYYLEVRTGSKSMTSPIVKITH